MIDFSLGMDAATRMILGAVTSVVFPVPRPAAIIRIFGSIRVASACAVF